MNKDALTASATAAGIAGIAGIFLPNIDDAFKAHPTDETFGYQLDRGTVLYLTVVITIGTLHSIATDSILPLVTVGAIAGLVVTNLHTAFDTET